MHAAMLRVNYHYGYTRATCFMTFLFYFIMVIIIVVVVEPLTLAYYALKAMHHFYTVA